MHTIVHCAIAWLRHCASPESCFYRRVPTTRRTTTQMPIRTARIIVSRLRRRVIIVRMLLSPGTCAATWRIRVVIPLSWSRCCWNSERVAYAWL